MADTFELQKGYRGPGDIEIQNMILVSPIGTSIDIRPIVMEFSVYQNLFDHHLSCELVLNDSLGLISNLNSERKDGYLGYTGSELLFVSYKTRDESSPLIRNVFGLHELTDRQRIDEKNESYLLNGISIEAYATKLQNVSRALGRGAGKEIYKMVESLIDEFYINNEFLGFYKSYQNIFSYTVRKNKTVDKTNGRQKFVIPNLTVDETMSFLCSQADNDKHIPFFLFYEDNTGYNFRDLNTLVEQEVKANYQYLPSNAPLDQKDATQYLDSTNITTFKVIKQTSYLRNQLSGMFLANTINVDILQKKKKEVAYNYENAKSKFSKLQKDFDIPFLGNQNSAQYMFTSRTGHAKSGSPFQAENPAVKKMNEFAASKKSYMRYIFNTVLEVTVPGDSTLNVGDVVYLNIPNATDLDSLDNKQDKYLSGKYIITKLRQKMRGQSGDSFISVFECAKDFRIR
jgi:hypothetical protein